MTPNEEIEELLKPLPPLELPPEPKKRKFPFNPTKDKSFWYAVSVACVLIIVASLSLSTYSTNKETVGEDKLNRIETLCRSATQEDLDVATGHLILAFGDLANALNAGITRESPERNKVDSDLKTWTEAVRIKTEARDNAIVKCAELVGRSVPSQINIPTTEEGDT